MELWNRQIKLARYMLLGTVILTVINIACLLGNADLFISYCAAVPYYLVWLGKLFDNGLYLGVINGEFTATGLVMAGVVLGIWLILWWLAKNNCLWLKLGLAVVVIDLVLLVLLARALFENWTDCLWEAAFHLGVIWEIAQGIRAWKRQEEYLANHTDQPTMEYV